MTAYIVVKEWRQYQHYHKRNPPWIKLHREMLTSNTWVSLDDASRVLAIAIMLLAAATNNKVPADPEYLKRVAYLNKAPDWSKLVKVGFIEVVGEIDSASAAQANAINGAVTARPETETETEQSNVHFEEFWKHYPRRQDRGHAEKAYAKAIHQSSPADILAGLRRYEFTDDPKFIPLAATWLNGHRWRDEKPPKASGPPSFVPGAI